MNIKLEINLNQVTKIRNDLLCKRSKLRAEHRWKIRVTQDPKFPLMKQNKMAPKRWASIQLVENDNHNSMVPKSLNNRTYPGSNCM